MMGYKIWCNFRECSTVEVRRIYVLNLFELSKPSLLL
jgi:hypothetical protein